MTSLINWATDNPVIAAATAAAATAAIAVAIWGIVWAATAIRNALTDTPAAILVATVAALACTAYSGDTSWRFAEHHLDMVATPERIGLFAAGELALLACALMARENIHQTTTDTQIGTAGVPGVLVWVITGVQIIPAFAEGGLLGGVIRGFFGPVAAALLWHLAMGIDIRRNTPDALSSNLIVVIGRELRERFLSRLGLGSRNRTAEQITRDRWTVRAVELATQLARMGSTPRWGRGWSRRRIERRLSTAVGRALLGASPEQRRKLLDLLAHRLHSASLATIDLDSPWEAASTTQAIGQTPSPATEAQPGATDTSDTGPGAAIAAPSVSDASVTPATRAIVDLTKNVSVADTGATAKPGVVATDTADACDKGATTADVDARDTSATRCAAATPTSDTGVANGSTATGDIVDDDTSDTDTTKRPTYTNPYEAAIRPLYNDGHRPTTTDMTTAIQAAGLKPVSSTARAARARIESREPDLRDLPSALYRRSTGTDG